MRLLVGDVGGTKTGLAIVEDANAGVHVESRCTRASGDYRNLGDLIEASGLLSSGTLDGACIGVAGPVRDNRCEVTNLPWVVDGAELSPFLGVARVEIINDLEAFGWGLDGLAGDQLICLNQGDPVPGGNQGIIAPGTGLGEAFRVWDGCRYLTRASEGSHADFSPSDQRDCDILQWLTKEHGGHVSWERLASGEGIPALYRFLRLQGVTETGNPKLDSAAEIVEAARAGKDPESLEAVRWFLGLVGAEAGNHALKVMATGGVFLGGGIPPKMLDFFQDGPFLEGFFHKGRMSDLMRRMPVHLVMEKDTPLLGAAVYWSARLDR